MMTTPYSFTRHIGTLDTDADNVSTPASAGIGEAESPALGHEHEISLEGQQDRMREPHVSNE